tara:strand:+ start:2234 stop:3760 length:1527 start_codon:yes stop_codon:yes gene_type:complete
MKIVIVGGGTSGWLCAAAMRHKLPFADLTLIDKEVSTPVAVGEATLLSFEQFLEDECGFDIRSCLKEFDTTLKAGILYPDWGYDGNAPWHPFYFLDFPSKDWPANPLIDGWSLAKEFQFESLMTLYGATMENNVDKEQLKGGYALHIDCIKLVNWLRDQLKGSINFIEKEVVGIAQHSDRGIESIIVEGGDIVEGDLFIDCTGYASILKDVRDTVDLSDRLFTNTAISAHIPYENKEEELKPYTTATAVDHGWVWNTPLQSRIGSGLVFNKDITSIDEAKEYFCKFWDGRCTPDQLRINNWSPYYDRNQWKGNVISIGLSAGFIEPLESTGIALICEGIGKVCKLLESGYYRDFDVEFFNTWMRQCFEVCSDFVSMHYSKSTKDTPFWRYVRETFTPSQALEFYADNMKSDRKSILGGKDCFFGGTNWIHWMIMLGYEFAPKTYMIDKKPKEIFPQMLRWDKSMRKQQFGKSIVKHQDFIDSFLKKKDLNNVMNNLNDFRGSYNKRRV